MVVKHVAALAGHALVDAAAKQAVDEHHNLKAGQAGLGMTDGLLSVTTCRPSHGHRRGISHLFENSTWHGRCLTTYVGM